MGIPTDLEKLVGGFNPSEQYESQLGLFPIYGKIKKMFQTTNQDGIFGFSPSQTQRGFCNASGFLQTSGCLFFAEKNMEKQWRNVVLVLCWYYVDKYFTKHNINIIST